MDVVYQFKDCFDGSNIFRFGGALPVLSTGSTYYISGGTDFVGCATVVTEDGSGELYESTGVVFTLVTNCASTTCTDSKRSATLSKCSDGSILNALVNGSEAFVGATYLYNGQCYEFIQFAECPDDTVCPDLGDPDYDDCNSCISTPTPTPTPYVTPSQTPTPSTSPLPCPNSEYCFNTNFPSLSGYNGTYTIDPFTYNSKPFYVGENDGVIYYTGSYWCLGTGSDPSSTTCLLQGKSPCFSDCPDLSPNIFTVGACVPTPVPIDCTVFDFEAYFNCNFPVTATPTPTPPANCDVVDFDIQVSQIPVTPTPTPDCSNTGIDFTIDGFVPVASPTPSPTPTNPTTRNVEVGGAVTFEILQESFDCTTTKVLVNCNTGQEYYTNDSLIFGGVPVVVGITMLVYFGGSYKCVYYDRNVDNISSNTTIDVIIEIYNEKTDCSVPQFTPTATLTPTITPTTTVTPSTTYEPDARYVYQSCDPIGVNTKPTQVIQTSKSSIPTVINFVFKDNSGNCWFYVGKYNTSYIAPVTVFVTTYNGDYFQNSPTQNYQTCEICSTSI